MGSIPIRLRKRSCEATLLWLWHCVRMLTTDAQAALERFVRPGVCLCKDDGEKCARQVAEKLEVRRVTETMASHPVEQTELTR